MRTVPAPTVPGPTVPLALASVASCLAWGLGPSAAHAAETAPETHRERGYVLECTGTEIGGRSKHRTAQVTLYENDVYFNDLQIVIDGKPRLSADRHPADIIERREVQVGADIAGHRAVVVGSVGREKERTPVREEIENDAGKHVVSEGYHRQVHADLGLLYRRANFQLACDPAFFYDLEVTTTDLT
jgi:hypothetical protein